MTAANTIPRCRPGPLLDEAAKQRAALMMEYRGKPPAAALQQQGSSSSIKPGSGSSPRRPLSERQQLERRFAEVTAEVEEREAFLRDMQVGRSRGRAAAAAGGIQQLRRVCRPA